MRQGGEGGYRVIVEVGLAAFDEFLVTRSSTWCCESLVEGISDQLAGEVLECDFREGHRMFA